MSLFKESIKQKLTSSCIQRNCRKLVTQHLLQFCPTLSCRSPLSPLCYLLLAPGRICAVRFCIKSSAADLTMSFMNKWPLEDIVFLFFSKYPETRRKYLSGYLSPISPNPVLFNLSQAKVHYTVIIKHVQ